MNLQNGGMGHRMKFHKAGLWVMAVILLTAMAGWVWAGEDEDTDVITGAKSSDFIKERSYIGVIGTSADIDQFGDFNGTGIFSFVPSSGGVTEEDLIPAITREFGWGVILGHREGPWAGEISFWRSDHTGTNYVLINGAPTTITEPASLQAINIDFKRYFFTELPTQPFFDLGVSFPWLFVRQDSLLVSSTSTSVDDETISGIGLNLGAGLEIYLDQNFSLVGGAYERWTEFDQVNGAAKIPLDQMYFDGNPSDVGALSGNGLNVYVGATFGVQ